MIVVDSARADWLEQMYINRSRMSPDGTLGHDLDRAVHDDGNDRHTSRDGEHEWTLLERAQRVRMSACALRKHNDRVTRADAFSGDVVSSERRLPVLALDLDHPDTSHRRAKDRNFEQLRFRHELVARQHLRERGDVEPADVT